MSNRLMLELPRTCEAPRVARRRMSEWLATAADRTGLEDAVLLVSELVTNAVVHGHGRIELRAELDDDRLAVHVLDEGEGFVPSVRVREIDGSGGVGLGIVEAAASRWGVRSGAADAWFELDRHRHGYSSAPAEAAPFRDAERPAAPHVGVTPGPVR